MKPNYALSLSFDGIKFFCRVDGGWHQMGDVPLEHVDLDTALSKLRKLGEDHAGGDALCKIILPQDQIKYLTLDPSEGNVDDAVAKALEDATPYAVSDLAFDFIETDAGIQVAAAAKETLSEALSFAQEHGFHAVSFAAQPAADQFRSEPFFGVTPVAASLVDDPDAIKPDDHPLFVVSEGPLPAQQTPDPAPSFASSRLLAEATSGSEGGAQLGGASRSLPPEDGEITTLKSPALAEGDNSVASQTPRFDPATLVAGLKQRPEPSKEIRPRGSARTIPAAPAPLPRDTVATPTVSHSKPEPAQSTTSDPAAAQTAPKVGGKPRYLGVILFAVLLAFLAGVAVWASIFSDDGVAGWFSPQNDVEIIPLEPEPSLELETTALPPVSNETITDTAEIEALDNQEGILIDPVLEAVVPQVGEKTIYAATGIWDRAPAQPLTPSSETSEAIYLASFEPVQQTHDAIALPTFDSFQGDITIAQQNDPVAAGISIDLDDRGLVIATAEGAISPEGILVYLGKPPSIPASFPDRAIVQDTAIAEAQAEAQAEVSRLAAFRPKLRPTDLTEQNERATLGGSTRSEIAGIRPKLRPERAAVQLVSIDPAAIQSATDDAILGSVRPRSRPANFARTVKQQQERLATVAVPREERVAPTIPTTASVARNATQENVLNLRKVNLIGVYGASNDRRALVRLASGRYKKVQIGDRIDGGKIAAIGKGDLHYVKGGRTIVLKMPRG